MNFKFKSNKALLISHLKESHSVINEEALKILVTSASHLSKQHTGIITTADESDSAMITTANKFKSENNG
jgi:hypothetical protein